MSRGVVALIVIVVGLLVRVAIQYALRVPLPECPFCGNAHVRRSGGHHDCDSCGQTF